MLSLGVYPDVTLKPAGERRDELRALLREGIDPGAERMREKTAKVALTANALEFIARERHQLQTVKWSASHVDRIMRRFEREVFPWLVSRDIAAIEPPTCCKSFARSKSVALTKPRTAFLKVSGKFSATQSRQARPHAIHAPI